MVLYKRPFECDWTMVDKMFCVLGAFVALSTSRARRGSDASGFGIDRYTVQKDLHVTS